MFPDVFESKMIDVGVCEYVYVCFLENVHSRVRGKKAKGESRCKEGVCTWRALIWTRRWILILVKEISHIYTRVINQMNKNYSI